MPVFECRGCPNTEPCRLFILDEDCVNPDACPWGTQENRPVWCHLEVVE